MRTGISKIFFVKMVFLEVCLCSIVTGRIIYVDADAPGPVHDGGSWTNAYNYLQDGLAVAISGDQIRVAEGIYKPDSNSTNPDGTGDRKATFQLINGVDLRGGYAGYGQPEPNERDIELYETILSGDLLGNDNPNTPVYELLGDPCRGDNPGQKS